VEKCKKIDKLTAR